MSKALFQKITGLFVLTALMTLGNACSQQGNMKTSTVVVESRDTVVTFDPATKQEKIVVVVRYDTIEVKNLMKQ